MTCEGRTNILPPKHQKTKSAALDQDSQMNNLLICGCEKGVIEILQIYF